jgi:hypothetical protein
MCNQKLSKLEASVEVRSFDGNFLIIGISDFRLSNRPFIRLSDYRTIDYRTIDLRKLSDYLLSDLGMQLSDYRLSDPAKNYRCPAL